MYKAILQTLNTSGQNNTKEYIVLHHTWTKHTSIKSALRTLTQGAVSAHYVIDVNGDIYKINSDDDVLWHCWESSWDGKTGLNAYSIGIEIVGPLPGFTDAQRVAVRKLVQHLMHAHTIPAIRVVRHKDIAPWRKNDPDDTLRSVQYPSYAAYQHSFDTVHTIIWFYHDLFLKEFSDILLHKQQLISDIDGVVARVTKPDGTIDIDELVYFVCIGFERLHQQMIHLEKQQKRIAKNI